MNLPLVTLLVGSHFYPPSKTLLEHLPAGTPLRLVPEPDNPWDENAIKVMLDPEDIPKEAWGELDMDLPNSGYDMALILAEGPRQIGHVGATGGKVLSKTEYSQGNVEFLQAMAEGPCRATLAWDGQGRLLVRLEREEGGE